MHLTTLAELHDGIYKHPSFLEIKKCAGYRKEKEARGSLHPLLGNNFNTRGFSFRRHLSIGVSLDK